MPANTGVAPVCNALAEPPSFATKPPPLPVYSVPSASNPQSIVRAVQQLQAAVAALAAAIPPNNVPSIGGFTPSAGGGVPGFGGTSPQKQAPNDWTEVSRVTQNVKVVNPDDDSQFVIVKEIVQLIFEHSTTGERIVIKRDAG